VVRLFVPRVRRADRAPRHHNPLWSIHPTGLTQLSVVAITIISNYVSSTDNSGFLCDET
jgi:hypothetical protein